MRNSEIVQSSHLTDRLAARIEAEMGWSFPEAKRRDLSGAVGRIAEDMELDSDACIAWLLDGRWDKKKADLCAFHLTIGETYFFREPRAFDLVCDYARKKRERAHGKLRIWSAGCCTGEEAYSIAMTLRQRVPELDPDRISILATDLNSRNLRLARTGVYRQWSFRNTGTAVQKMHFSQEGANQFRINEDIRKLVAFAELNLAVPMYPAAATDTHAMDIIFCRNVLMYFSRSQARKVIERFRQCLVNGGWLIVSPGEASLELFAGFSCVYYPDAIYFQKSDSSKADKPPLHALPFTNRVPEEFGPAAPTIAFSSRPAAPVLQRPPSQPMKAANAPPAKRQADNIPAPAETGANVIGSARILANEGRIAEAMQCLDQALENGSPTTEIYHAKALLAMESGNPRDAMRSLKRAIYLKPDFILAHYLMGILQTEQNRRRDAARQFETARELLSALDRDEIVPGSDGLPAAYLLDSVRTYLERSDR